MHYDRVRRARPLLGTLVEISLAGRGETMLHEAVNAAFDEILRVHELMSVHSRHSDVYRLNNAPVGQPVAVDACTWRVLDLAAIIANASDGVFDITVGAAVMARGDLPRMLNKIPDVAASWCDVELLPDNQVRLRRALAIDLGGIAKGYAVDNAVRIVRERGVPAGCVNAGGDLRVFGDEVLTVHVRDAVDPAIARAEVDLRDCAFATSASYSNSDGFDASGNVFDRRSNGNVAAGRSGSVRASSCAVADALAKCALLLGTASAPLLRQFGAEGFVMVGDSPVVIETGEDADGCPQPARSAAESGIEFSLANARGDVVQRTLSGELSS